MSGRDMALLLRAEIATLPPSVNHTYRRTSKGLYKTREAKDWQSMAVFILGSARKRAGLKSPHAGKAKLCLRFHTSNNRSMDIDNRVKAVQDCLEPAGILKNDNQIWSLTAERVCDGREMTEIEIWRDE